MHRGGPVIAKARVIIFVTPRARSTEYLVNHVGKYIDLINKSFILEFINVTEKNAADVRRRGITKTPTLVHNGKHYVTFQKIVEMLTPPSRTKERFGVDATSPEELASKYMSSVINSGDDESPDNPENREDDIRRKMAAFQKRRPEMKGVGEKQHLRGGRKIKPGKNVGASFNDDETFLDRSGRAQQEMTPTKRYMDELSGEAILEDYFNAEADAHGRKQLKTYRRPRG
jgi:hypothetical protein